MLFSEEQFEMVEVITTYSSNHAYECDDVCPPSVWDNYSLFCETAKLAGYLFNMELVKHTHSFDGSETYYFKNSNRYGNCIIHFIR